METCYPLDGKQVVVTTEIHYGNPGQRLVLKAGTKAIAHAATNLPNNSAVHYWLTPVGPWPEYLERWAEDVGCGAHTDELRLDTPNDQAQWRTK